MIFPGTGLALPRFSSQVPGQLALGKTDSPRRFADALFRANVLRDSDWLGDFASTLTRGLTRWINVDLGLGNLQRFELIFGFAEQPTPKLDNPLTPYGDDLCCFEMVADDGAELFFVGESIEALNAIARNAGFAALRVLENALGVTLGCYTPLDAFDYLSGCDFYDQQLMEEIDEANAEGRKPALMDTPSTYRQCKFCPFAAMDGAPYFYNAERALRKARKLAPPGSWEKRIFELVEDLQFWVKDFTFDLNGRIPLEQIEQQEMEMDTIYSGIAQIAWQKDDCVQQVYDEMCNDAQQVGCYSQTLMWSSWNLDTPQSVAAALDPFRRAAPIIRACDEMLSLLHRVPTPGAKPFKTYRVPKSELDRWRDLWPSPPAAPRPLVEILGGHQPDDEEEMTTDL